MTVFPSAIDDDQTIIRVDDNINEYGALAINQLRSATFAIEKALGLNPGGSVTSVSNRLGVSLNPDGTIKSSALTSLGLVTLPIVNSHVGFNAGIAETKLALDYSTSDLHTLIVTNQALLTSLITFANETFADLNIHIAGGEKLSDGVTLSRHVLSQIDINQNPVDSRDPSFNWTGLTNRTGTLRTVINALDALTQINDDLTSHENSISEAHNASAIIVDTDNFKEIPVIATNAQAVFDYLDQAEVLNIGLHRATQHINGIPKIARSEFIGVDGYGETLVGFGQNVVIPTLAEAYLLHPPNITPSDDLSFGDDIIKFIPDNTNFAFDAMFSQVKVGDVIRIDYHNGLEATFPIESIRYTPGSEWLVRINGVNLCESLACSARIDRSLVDRETSGILSVASANAWDATQPAYTTILSSVIVGNPKGASALGLGFDANQINSTHYNLYLQLYPSGNPTDRIINLPAIDVTGNAGVTPGKYTLKSIVESCNNELRTFGYNYRFIAYEYNGEFGIMLADAIGNVSFSIVSGDNSSGTLQPGSFTNNIVGDASDTFDALGFGVNGSDIASPVFQSTWVDATAAQKPTKVICPLKNRFYYVNGQRLDKFEDTYLAEGDGYWDGYISARNQLGATTVETTYTVLNNLAPSGLKPGKTIVIQPAVAFSDPLYSDIDYGRFIIKSVNFIGSCGSASAQTQITVINSLHASVTATASSAMPTLPVKLYFSSDSVDFDDQSLIDSGSSVTNFGRFHEIYITNTGKTFSHERARFIKQTETPTLLSSSNWHIQYVSPKLRGYTDGNALVFNRYLRFYILTYNGSSGEYTAVLGQRDPLSVNALKLGTIVTGRKNVVTRVYDETNIDYIDLIFRDDGTTPGQDVISGSISRYMDIEIFPTLQLQDDIMLLATCEVNWNPEAGQSIVQYVENHRQFGSVDETDFSNSALDYISAGDKFLHANGVIRGLSLDYISLVSNSGEIFFKGGLAEVDGKILAVNNESCTIPQVYPAGTSLPQTLNWAICVNSSGNLTPIIITSTKQQFFATTGSGSYYIPSCTFFELVNSRKDLLPIYIANVTIASLTINTVTDIRKFVGSDGGNELILSSDSNTVGQFYSVEALKNWINNFGGKNNKVKLKGDFTFTTNFDLSGFTKKVKFDGTDANITLSLGARIVLGSNVTVDGFVISYSAAGFSASAGTLLSYGQAAFYCSTTVQNVCIENCTVTWSSTDRRPPFVLFEMAKGQVNKNISIKNNIFIDTTPTTTIGALQAAVAFVAMNTGVSTDPALLINCSISGNQCSHNQGIYVTTATLTDPGLNCVNVVIEKNNCGVIGVLPSAKPTTLLDVTQAYKTDGVLVTGNNCSIIGNFFGSGQYTINRETAGTTTVEYGLGKLTITDNNCHMIYLQAFEDIASGEFGGLIIDGNFLTGVNSANISSYYAMNTVPSLLSSSNIAITVVGKSTSDPVSHIITNNHIGFGRDSGVSYGYLGGIVSSAAGTISKNIIKGLNNLAVGITPSGSSGGSQRYFTVTENSIYRGSETIAYYILLPPTASASNGICTDNVFDSNTTDGAVAYNRISDFSGKWIVERNKGQSVLCTIPASIGAFGISIGGFSGEYQNVNTAAASIMKVGSDGSLECTYQDATTEVHFGWIIPFTSLPQNCKVRSCSVSFSCDTNPTTARVASIFFYDTLNGTSVASTLTYATGAPVALTHSGTGYTTDSVRDGKAVIDIRCQSSGTPTIVSSIATIDLYW